MGNRISQRSRQPARQVCTLREIGSRSDCAHPGSGRIATDSRPPGSKIASVPICSYLSSTSGWRLAGWLAAFVRQVWIACWRPDGQAVDPHNLVGEIAAARPAPGSATAAMSDATDRHDQIASAAGRTHQLCLSKWKKYIKRECIRRGYRLWLPKTDGTKLGFSSQSEGPLSHSCTVHCARCSTRVAGARAARHQHP